MKLRLLEHSQCVRHPTKRFEKFRKYIRACILPSQSLYPSWRKTTLHLENCRLKPAFGRITIGSLEGTWRLVLSPIVFLQWCSSLYLQRQASLGLFPNAEIIYFPKISRIDHAGLHSTLWHSPVPLKFTCSQPSPYR